MSNQIIKFRCYNLTFEYDSDFKDYLDTNYAGTYQCIGLEKYSYNLGLLDEDYEEDLEGNVISTIAKMRNINTDKIINMEIYRDDYVDFYSICIELTQNKLIGGYNSTNAYPTVQERSETIFNILVAEQQMENDVSPNVKQVIQNSDLNRYLMGFI